MFDYIGHTLMTVTGFYQEPFSESWDLKLNDMIESGEVVECRECAVDFLYRGSVISVWVGNKWYSFGYEYLINWGAVPHEMRFRPRFKTMKKLFRIHSKHRRDELIEYYQSLHKRKIDKFAIRRFGE
ncbi:hypothetical protein ACOGYR_001720 [Edwardsiella piscicida]|uniref:hypothetical protein n=1 Tax=Edwardsiella piscicida TaxID=1263550 RepID=UPI00101AB466|nr:hypothetical protein [Edwardsiella piscicida]QBB13893.1 hypothetical protein EVK84_15775 [Edwardsiella piscicida]UCQ29758.1 hypothetical protein DCF74_09625 [Edwardsiella piscicida]